MPQERAAKPAAQMATKRTEHLDVGGNQFITLSIMTSKANKYAEHHDKDGDQFR